MHSKYLFRLCVCVFTENTTSQNIPKHYVDLFILSFSCTSKAEKGIRTPNLVMTIGYLCCIFGLFVYKFSSESDLCLP